MISSIRGDRIYWLDENDSIVNLCQDQIYYYLKTLQQLFNQTFYLNLRELEFHYALYPTGACYAKHIDQHKGQNQRVITLIHYLNPNWNQTNGGRLLMYDNSLPNQLIQTIEPRFGRTVFFLSDLFPHEVERSSVTRYSLTGWFRTQTL